MAPSFHGSKAWVMVLSLLICLGAGGKRGPSKDAQVRTFRLNLRTRVEPFKGSSLWQEVGFQQEFSCHDTALLICDMWDKHWCSGASQRVDALAGKMEPVIEAARARGILIIHAPSETMDFYKNTPERQRILAVRKVEPPPGLNFPDPPLPIDDSDGGCDTKGDRFYKAWARENPQIGIAPEDVISDDGNEIYSLLKQQAIKNVLVMGVHTNMCVLNRPFAIKQMTKWGIRCILVRDLTDTMYNPQDRPYVPHDQGTQLVVEYIEKYWCPSVLSTDLVRSLPPLD
jgi:nicotinamidase-related amidase